MGTVLSVKDIAVHPLLAPSLSAGLISAPAAAGALALPSPLVPAGAPALEARAAEMAAPSVGSVPAAAKSAARAAQQPLSADRKSGSLSVRIEAALTKGLFANGVVFDAAGKAEPSVGAEFAGLQKYTPAYGLRLAKQKIAAKESVYLLTSNGIPVPLKGDFASYVQSGQLTIYKVKSKTGASIYVVEPGKKGQLKKLAADLDSLAGESIAQGAKAELAAKRLEQLIRSQDAGVDLVGEINGVQAQLNDYVKARNEWKTRRDAFLGKAKEEDKVFLKSILDGADYKKSHSNLTVQAFLAERFPNADALLAARFPDDIEELRRTIPNLTALNVNDFTNSIFTSRELTAELLASRKALKKTEIQPARSLSQVKFVYSPKDIPRVMKRLAQRENAALKAFEPELRGLLAEALPSLEQWNKAVDQFERALRKAKKSGDVNEALAGGQSLIKNLTADNRERQAKWSALMGKATDPAIKAFLTAVYTAVDANRSSLSLDAVIQQRFPNADALLAALYPKQMTELRRYVPNLGSMAVGDFQNSLFSDPELVAEFLKSRRDLTKSERKRIPDQSKLSRVAFFYTPQDVAGALARMGKGENNSLKPFTDDLSALASESMPVVERWNEALDRFDAAIGGAKSKDDAGTILSDLNRIHEGAQANAAAWGEKRDALLGKAADPAVKSFLTAATNALDPAQLTVDSMIASRFANADELLEAVYPKHIERLRRYIPNLGSVGVGDFENSLFASPELTAEFLTNRKTFKKKDYKDVSALSDATFVYSPKDIPGVLERLGKSESGSLKPFEVPLRALAAESLPILDRSNEALDRLENAVRKDKANGEVAAIFTEINRINAGARENAAHWQKKRDELLGRTTNPAIMGFLTAVSVALDPTRTSLDSVIATRFANADELLAALYPENIADLRRFIPTLASMKTAGFDKSIFVDRAKVGEFLANRALLGESAPQPQSTGLQDMRYVVPTGGDKLKPKFKSGDFRLPYRVPGVKDLEDFQDPNDAGYATFRADATSGEQKEKLKTRFGIFSELIETNFRVLPIISRFTSEPMPKAAARAIVAEVGTMVTHYETLTTSAKKAADGAAVRERYALIVAELNQLWKDVPETGTLPEDVAQRISSIEAGADLPAIKNLHTIINFIHQKSFEALSAQEAAGNERGLLNFNNEIPFMDLGDEPVFKNNRLLSKPLLALLKRDKRPGGHQNDAVIIRGNEAWVHAHLGLHSAEIYVKFADPDDGGMLRIRYQEGTNTPIGNPARLALVREEHTRLGIHTEVEDTRPRDPKTGKPLPTHGKDPLHLVSIIDKDHGLTSEAQLERLFSFTLQGLHDTLDMNCAFNNLGEDGCAKVVPQLADIYMAEGRWGEGWNRSGNYHDFYKQYIERNKTRETMRKT
ncbi:MAG: hypothetical protein ACHQ2Z_11790, partial [Elusimicrobiota bacterium]